MPAPQLPDFERSLALTQGNLDAGGLSECHGVACGLLVRQPDSRADAYLALLEMLEIVTRPGVAMREVLVELFDAAGRQLADQEMRLVIWLPDDEEPLDDRTIALTQWCNGFLASIGSGQDGRLKTLSDEASEALADLGEVALAESPGEVDGGSEDFEEEEQAFAEIVEYIRVAVLILREDLRGPQAGDSIH